MSTEVGPEGSLSARLGFPETAVEVGFSHPGVRHVTTAAGGSASFLVHLDDDRITDLEVDIGFGHRGFEFTCEQGTWADALPHVSRLGLATGVLAETAYCLAVESLAGLPVPDRAIWGRMLVGELARITDHAARLGAVLNAIAIGEGALVAHRLETFAMQALGAATGGAPLDGFVRIGGVRAGLEGDLAEDWTERRTAIDAELAKLDRVAVKNPTVIRRLRDVAPISADDAIAWGVTGPALRAAGAPLDLRRDRPYLAYGALDFDVPVGERGDGLDRLLVVIEEIRQSLGMVDQCHKLLTSLGPGELCTPGSDDLHVASGEGVASVETSTGELGFLLASDGVGLPRRVRCRAPSFYNAQALPAMLIGSRLDDVLPTVALLHIVGPECDR
ncbi:MAG: hypothetical protein NXI30_23635 [bacterium]|nr:hypothetical protein [bacterium]